MSIKEIERINEIMQNYQKQRHKLPKFDLKESKKSNLKVISLIFLEYLKCISGLSPFKCIWNSRVGPYNGLKIWSCSTVSTPKMKIALFSAKIEKSCHCFFLIKNYGHEKIAHWWSILIGKPLPDILTLSACF